MDCNCPQASTLIEIVAEECGVDLKQIQRLAFQRAGTNFDSAGTPPSSILNLAAWQVFKTANDATKIVITPMISSDPIIEAGEKITTGGGDNSTLNGVEELEGVNPSNFSCKFKSLSSKVESQIKNLICEKNLVVYLFLQGGRIAAVELTPTTSHKGFESKSVFLSDRNNAGFGTKDTFNFSFSLPSGWSEKLVVLKPTWNPLTDL
ncbi:hypothetical protein LIT13_06695 [Flavobacterium psychrophilum]|uniref:hypothetical protein n=1 Tax=Flavobacterium psychrophilum TaxID=96345 RepID=UPI001D08375D|nr:hypothetical protein [Flavobacterium psychrophilum]MCB5972663.1 hypothetical protein [Flavobacterium psychrophilum]MCB5978994.1 hypothetical protein [Flavobacterium psychrophilum]MCB5983284.1 hypothetical protein [Flavobacterium psychrophilum]